MNILLRLCAAFGLSLVVTTGANAHWPGQPPHQMAQLGDLKLESGEVIKNFRMSYVTHGKLNAAKDNAILFIHGFAANHHQFDHMIGPGRPLDIDRHFVICPDPLGSMQINFEHTTSPTTSGLKIMWDACSPIPMIDAGKPLVVLAGIRGGCWELFGNGDVQTIRDLQGKTPVVHYLGGGDHVLLSSMLAHVGIDPEKDVRWITGGGADAKDVFASGKADAFIGFAQEPAEVRARNVGRVMKTSYTRWRTDNPEDTLRFHALRLRDVGMLKSSPRQIIAKGTDWRFLNEIRRELKA